MIKKVKETVRDYAIIAVVGVVVVSIGSYLYVGAAIDRAKEKLSSKTA